jgi:hypothetical protein
MTDLFADKAADYDDRPLPQRISNGVSAALFKRLPLRPNLTTLDFGAVTIEPTCQVDQEGRRYPISLATARRGE